MGFDLIEILKAWATAENPNKMQKELAELRLNVCMGCDMRKEIIHNKKWSALCGKCGCPLSKKIFTDQYGSCPLDKWNIVEEPYVKSLTLKSKKQKTTI
jgi:hypothetical protein